MQHVLAQRAERARCWAGVAGLMAGRPLPPQPRPPAAHAYSHASLLSKELRQIAKACRGGGNKRAARQAVSSAQPSEMSVLDTGTEQPRPGHDTLQQSRPRPLPAGQRALTPPPPLCACLQRRHGVAVVHGVGVAGHLAKLQDGAVLRAWRGWGWRWGSGPDGSKFVQVVQQRGGTPARWRRSRLGR